MSFTKCEQTCKKCSQTRVTWIGGSCPADDKSVDLMPINWLPKRSGPSLNQYLQKRQSQHDELLAQMTKDAGRINKEIESKIRKLADDLNLSIKSNQREIECELKKCDAKCGILSKEAFDESKELKKVEDLHKRRRVDISEFTTSALAVEKERENQLKILLRDYFQRLIQIGNMPPCDIVEDFDQRIYEINQQLISNERAYSELRDHLVVHINKSSCKIRSIFRQFSLGIGLSEPKEIRRETEHKLHVKYTLRSQSAPPIEHKKHGHAAGSSLKKILSYRSSRYLQVKSERLSNKTIASGRKHDINDSRTSLKSIRSLSKPINTVGLKITPDDVDECVTRLVEAYHQATNTLIVRLSENLFAVNNAAYENDQHLHVSSIQDENKKLNDMIEAIVQRFSPKVIDSYLFNDLMDNSVSFDDATGMQTTLAAFAVRLYETYSILYDASHIWDDHIIRAAHAQKLTVTVVENLCINNDANEQDLELNFNMALEELLSCPDRDQIDDKYDFLLKLLRNIIENCHQHGENEIKELQNYFELSDIMTDVLLAELHYFIAKHPRIVNSNDELSPRRIDKLTSYGSYSRTSLHAEFEDRALMNWSNGFLENFENNIPYVAEEMSQQAERWVREKLETLQMRQTTKMISYAVRKERLQTIRKQRSAVLRHHENRLQSHLKAVDDFVKTFPVEVKKITSPDNPELFPIVKWTEYIKTQVDLATKVDNPEVKRLKMKSYATRLSRYMQLFKDSQEPVLGKCAFLMNNSLDLVCKSNFSFLSQIKMFSEGGSYSHKEALVTVKSLMSASQSIAACLKGLDREMGLRKENMINFAHYLIAPVNVVVEQYVVKPLTSKSKAQNKMKNAGMNEKAKNPLKKK